MTTDLPTRLLAIASGGGHWEQLMLMREAFSECKVHYVTTLNGLPERASLPCYTIVSDCNRNQPFQVARCAVQMLVIIMRFRPKIVISTGALPGAIGLIVAKLLGSRTVWVDSVANAEEFSMSGALAKRFADRWISQWRHVADASGALYLGSVL